jgi:hypothetical protein
MEGSNVYHDSVDKYFSQAVIYPLVIIHDSSFKSLSAKGFDLISHDVLRRKILNMHGHQYSSIKAWENQYNRDIYFDEMIKRFDKVEPWRFDRNGKYIIAKMKPNNYRALKTDLVYKSLIKSIQRDADQFLYSQYFNIIEELEELVSQIDKEVNRLE